MGNAVWIDGLFLTSHFQGVGKSRYLENLLGHIGIVSQGLASPPIHILLPSESDPVARRFMNGPGFRVIPCRTMRLRKLWRRGLSTVVAKAIGAEIFFLPEPVPIWSKPKRLAITIHDIMANLFPEKFRSVRGRVEQWAAVSSMRRADLIFTDSEHSKNDMVSAYRVPPEKIVVAHLGVDFDSFKPGPLNTVEERSLAGSCGVRRPYVLCVGAVERKKNLLRLIRSFCTLRDRRTDFPFQLVLAGRPGEGYEEIASLCVQRNHHGDIILTGGIPDRELILLYQGATCVAMPSFYEGFGLPVVEAMACGVPVLSSNRSSLPEIGGDAALYFDPDSEEEMCFLLEKILSDSALRQDLSRRGIARASTFSWASCARITLEALRQL